MGAPEKTTATLRIAVMGAGAVGSYLGGILARAGYPVTLIARGQHLATIQANGLHVRAQNGAFTVSVPATNDPQKVGPVDLVVYSVKTYHNQAVAPLTRPLVGKDTAVLTIQNGVDSWEQLQAGLGHGHVLPGAMYIEAQLEAPGVVRQQGSVCRLVFGEASGLATPQSQAVAQAFRTAGLDTEVAQDIQKVLWTKWLFIAALAGVTTAARASIADLLAVPASRDIVVSVMREIEAIGRRRGVNLDTDVVEATLLYMQREARSLKASMQKDFEAGRPIELEALTGAVARLGRQSGVPTPTNDALYGLLKPYDLKRQGVLGPS